MRSLAMTALFAAFSSIGNLQAQNLAEHAAAAAGATIGTAAGKPMSTAINTIFGQTDEQAKAASRTAAGKTAPQTRATPQANQPSTANRAATGAPELGPAFPGPSGSSSGVTASSIPSSPPRRRVSTHRFEQPPETGAADETAFSPAQSPIVV